MSQQRRKDAAVYDYASTYHLGERPLSPTMHGVYDKLRQLSTGSHVLDVGCGAGRLARNAALPRNYSFLGIDISADAIGQFQELIDEKHLPDRAIQGDITQLDLSTLPIQAAVSWRVLHALPPSLQEQVCEAVFRALPPGGEFYLAVLSDTDWKRQALEERGQYKQAEMVDCAEIMGLDQPWPLYFFTEERLRELATKTGFEMVSTSTFQEETGFDTLKATHPNIEYRFATFKKPALAESSDGVVKSPARRACGK